jgi:hypothetical protein
MTSSSLVMQTTYAELLQRCETPNCWNGAARQKARAHAASVLSRIAFALELALGLMRPHRACVVRRVRAVFRSGESCAALMGHTCFLWIASVP